MSKCDSAYKELKACICHYILAKERDEFGEKEDKLKAELNEAKERELIVSKGHKQDMDSLLEQVKLGGLLKEKSLSLVAKAQQLQGSSEECLVRLAEMEKDRDFWKSKAERLAEALKLITVIASDTLSEEKAEATWKHGSGIDAIVATAKEALAAFEQSEKENK